MAGPITERQIAALRGYLTLDPERESLIRKLDDSDIPGFEKLALTMLSVMAGRLFSPTFERADIVRYVGRIRATRSETTLADDLDPLSAEATLSHALGLEVPYPADAQARMRATIVLLGAIVEELELDESQLEDVMRQAQCCKEK